MPTPASQPYGITAGPDHRMWFTEAMASAVGRLDLSPPDLTGPAITVASPRRRPWPRHLRWRRPRGAAASTARGPASPEREATADVGGGLRYSPDRDIYVWKTDKAWKGTCRRLLVQFV
ncbi:MAG: hypothetical protein ACRDHS_06865 [Actinomycetota bacterium]